MRSAKPVLIFTFALLLVSTHSAFAQGKISGGSGGFHIGPKFYNTQDYNYFLEDGVSNLANNLLRIGGGGYMIYKNVMLGGRGFYQGGESRDVTVDRPQQDSRNFTYSLNGGGGYLNLGYVIHSTHDLLVFPQLGIGYEALAVEKVLNEETTFNPREALSTEYRWDSPMLDLATGIDWFPFERQGPKIGLRLGYTISLQRNSDWSHTGGDFTDSSLPENSLDGFYFSIAIGGGGFTTQN